MNTYKTSKFVCAVAVMLAGFVGYGAFGGPTTQTECPSATLTTNTIPNIGTYYAMAKMTNTTAPYSFYVVPPTNTQTGTFQDVSGFPAPYSSSLMVTRKIDGVKWHTNNNNSITFPATNSSYLLTVYVNTTPPPPTNGQPVTLQVTWQ